MHGLSIQKAFSRHQACRKISSFVAFLLFFSGGTFAQTTEEELLTRLSLEQKVGQLMIWSYYGTQLGPHWRKVLERYQPGALIAFGRNIKNPQQIAKFNHDLQTLAHRKFSIPFFLLVDQEGGPVTRIRLNTAAPSALALNRTKDPRIVQQYGRAQAEMLAALGFNMNLAPVLDISDPDSDSFIGSRVFGADPEEVSLMAMAFSKGSAEAGIVPTAKHFPGHGNMMEDSHHRLPRKLASLERLQDFDLVPFKEFINQPYPRAIMMAHMSVPSMDPSGTPATYSHTVIEKHLREKMGFDGLVMTDDLEMGGASISEEIGERAIKAFLAGNDILMLAGHPDRQKEAFHALVQAVQNGRISEARLNRSVLRILRAKARLPSSTLQWPKVRLSIANLERISKQVMETNFRTALAEITKPWPKVTRKTRAVVFANNAQFYNGFRRHFIGQSEYYRLTPQTLLGVAKKLQRKDVELGIFYASGVQTARWLETLNPAQRAKLIVINCNHAGEVQNQNMFLAVFNLNSYSPESGEWVAQALVKSPAHPLRAPARRQARLADELDDEI